MRGLVYSVLRPRVLLLISAGVRTHPLPYQPYGSAARCFDGWRREAKPILEAEGPEKKISLHPNSSKDDVDFLCSALS